MTLFIPAWTTLRVFAKAPLLAEGLKMLLLYTEEGGDSRARKALTLLLVLES